MNLKANEILRISIPTVVISCLMSLFVASKWMENFSKTINFSIWLFLLCEGVILTIIVTLLPTHTKLQLETL